MVNNFIISTKRTISSHLKSCIFQVHFMCLLSRGMYLNRLCGKPVLQAQALSVIPPQFTSVSKKAFNINLLGRIIDWYRSSFPIQVTRDMMELTLVRINVLSDSKDRNFISESNLCNILAYLI